MDLDITSLLDEQGPVEVDPELDSLLEELLCQEQQEEEPPAAPVQIQTPVYIVYDPVLANVKTIKEKLMNYIEGVFLPNQDLVFIADNAHLFDEEDFLRIPHIFVRGETHYPKQFAMEMAINLKVISSTHGIPLKDLMKPYLSDDHCKCFCENKTNNHGCTRKRRWGCFTCSRHKDDEQGTDGYMYARKMLRIE